MQITRRKATPHLATKRRRLSCGLCRGNFREGCNKEMSLIIRGQVVWFRIVEVKIIALILPLP